MSTKTISSRVSDRIRLSVQRSHERRDHDRAMADPRIRDEHYAARSREVSTGGQDCPYCV